MAIVYGIDGTGSEVLPGKTRDAAYDLAFQNSFVRRICQKGGADALYNRGPVALGGSLLDAINTGRRHVQDKLKLKPATPVLLTGYSRGAAGVVSLAADLNRAGIPVLALMLFDCVDRHLAIDAETIPGNVAFVRHVLRDPDTSSRESFGNDGRLYTKNKTQYEEKFYMCTHGGMGGTPWTMPKGAKETDLIDEGKGVPFGGGITNLRDGITTVSYRQDAFVSKKVWSESLPFLGKHGFMV